MLREKRAECEDVFDGLAKHEEMKAVGGGQGEALGETGGEARGMRGEVQGERRGIFTENHTQSGMGVC